MRFVELVGGIVVGILVCLFVLDSSLVVMLTAVVVGSNVIDDIVSVGETVSVVIAWLLVVTGFIVDNMVESLLVVRAGVASVEIGMEVVSDIRKFSVVELLSVIADD